MVARGAVLLDGEASFVLPCREDVSRVGSWAGQECKAPSVRRGIGSTAQGGRVPSTRAVDGATGVRVDGDGGDVLIGKSNVVAWHDA